MRTKVDLRYQELIDLLREERGDQFKFQAFVSREKIPNTIEGRIPAAILDGSLEKAIGLPLSAEDSHVMLCGNPDMVKDTVELLKARNFRKNRRRTPGHITVENYW